MSERMEALLFASFFATPLHLYVGGGETTPDAGSTTHLALYAASAFVIGTLILSATRNLLSWLNPQAARGSHSGEAAATAAEQRAASRSPSPHHRPKPSTTRPPSRLQLTTGQQPHPPPTPKACLQHHHTPAAAAAATAPLATTHLFARKVFAWKVGPRALGWSTSQSPNANASSSSMLRSGCASGGAYSSNIASHF